ncbi:MAG: SagB/ThcOx family dehydrogenase [Deltaproteobacteria bacterium]|nr:SagB/ThcOx family dehydrogenase [Deltaproteobacteria bacterium]
MVMCSFFFQPPPAPGAELVRLPRPALKGPGSVEEALQKRRTVRLFASRSLDLKQVSQLLWATQGITDSRGLRTAPSAGATYPLEIYLVAGERGVTGLAPGIYRYRSGDHALELTLQGDHRAAVARACLSQSWMATAPVMVVFAAEFRRCTARYGDRGVMYTHMEVGLAGENLFLQAEALGLSAGIVGAFTDKAVSQTLKLPREHEPLLLMPVGYKH